MRKAYEKRVNEKWRRALRHLNINDNLFPNHKNEIEQNYPFNICSVYRVCEGAFNQCQLEKIVLEIVSFEVINSCYHAKLKDIKGDEIFGTFHADCRDLIK